MKHILLTSVFVALIFGSATTQGVQTSFQGGIGVGYIDANLWVPITGPLTEISIDIAPTEGSYPWKVSPLSFGLDLSYLYAKSIGEERYGRSYRGNYFFAGAHVGYTVKELSLLVGASMTSCTLSGSGPFFDSHVRSVIGPKASIRYNVSEKIVIQASVSRYKCDLDGFVSEFSRHNSTWIYGLTANYKIVFDW